MQISYPVYDQLGVFVDFGLKIINTAFPVAILAIFCSAM